MGDAALRLQTFGEAVGFGLGNFTAAFLVLNEGREFYQLMLLTVSGNRIELFL